MRKILLAAALFSSSAVPVQAATIIDTGIATPAVNARPINPTTVLLAQFNFSSATRIESIETFGRTVSSGLAKFSIFADAGNTPGALLLSDTVSLLASNRKAWSGISGLAWDLAQGTYWVGLGQGDPGYGAYVLGSAPNPLGLEGSFKPKGYISTDIVDLSWRIGGTVLSAVPEPTTWAAMICGFLLVGGALRHRARPAVGKGSTTPANA
jgi:hypothetical protein